ncbi:MAG: hypothetical protein VXV96_03050 [Bdellovibrionota bacterium]|nr:hypothetical protein [Bdellovibrionota bacterium]
MNWPFIRYFFSYLLHAKTRQKLLFIAIFGLVISSFALFVLQSTMGGLQEKLINRSKVVSGSGVISFPLVKEEEITPLFESLQKIEATPLTELELELLVKYGQFYAPIIIHGLKEGQLPAPLKRNGLKELVLPRPLAYKLNSGSGDLVRLMSPAHLDSFIGGIPRMASLNIDYLINTDVPEIDDFHGWAKMIRVQAIIGKKVVNKIRLYGDYDRSAVEELLTQYGPKGSVYKSWEEVNSTLVWALNLETIVMVFLFSAMTLLVSLAITSGLLIFFSKIKTDLASFWVLGVSEENVFTSTKVFLSLLTFLSVAMGLILATGLLVGLDHYGINVMPDVFVDRKIPVQMTLFGVLTSFFIPFIISLLFAWLSLKSFKKDVNYLTYIRTLGA